MAQPRQAPSDRRSETSASMSNKMWGGRFEQSPDAIMEDINVSIDVDRHLYAQDIAASKAHAAMLAAQGIITASDAKNIAKGLDTILSEIGKGTFEFKRESNILPATDCTGKDNSRLILVSI
jgi:argininosuccinate lyase